MKTYDEILNSMKNTFFDKCGENVDLMSDLGARFQAVASELFSLSCSNDFMLRQAFPQTAGGKYLDSHAALRGMERKTAAKAYGQLTFFAAQPAETELEISKGTVCSVKEQPYIQFETTEKAVIAVGEESVTVAAQAVASGADYNAEAGTVTVMVNPPSGITRVTNEARFLGGWEEENDEALRKRVLASYRVPPTGVSAQSLSEVIMQHDEVLDCHVYQDGFFGACVCLKTKSLTVSDALREAILDKLMIFDITATNVRVTQAAWKEYALNVTAEVSSADSGAVKEQIENVIRLHTDALKIGESLDLKKLSFAVSSIENVSYCEIGSSSAVSGIVSCNPNEYLRLKNLAVSCYEQ